MRLMTTMNNSRNGFRRRGAAYFMIIGASMLVAVIGVSAITVARLQTRTLTGTNDVREAGILAFSAIEHALITLDNSTLPGNLIWRTTHSSGVETSPISLGTGTISWMLVDEQDNDLADADSDPVRLYGIGRVGAATRVYSVLLSTDGAALTALEVALHAEGDLTFNSASVQCNQIMSGNGNATATGSFVASTVEVVGTYSGSVFFPTPTTGITPRTLPDSATVFDYYVANGTTIDFASLNAGAMEGVVLSSAANPYGSGMLNAQGIYVIDCANQAITIRYCRIVGTLVLLNVGSNSKVMNQLHWEPSVVNYPCLLAQGSMSFEFDSSQTLNEGSPYNVNYNPLGTPYNGDQDILIDDSYPTLINGLVYVSGSVNTVNSPAFDGVVVIGGAFICGSNLDLTYSQTFLDNPPPGFGGGGGPIAPGAGTWRRDLLP